MINETFFLNLDNFRNQYLNNKPFNYLTIDNFLEQDSFQQAQNDFDLNCKQTINYTHVSQSKRGLTNFQSMKPKIQKLINKLSSEDFLKQLEYITNLKNLKFDNTLHGGGLHEVLRGGYLNIHKDFGTHPTQKTWKRRINLLFYFNEVWQEEWNGALELWENDKSKVKVKINPIKNRLVIFNVIGAYHGHPDPLDCPKDITRKSLALYYFTDEGINQKTISTYYTSRPHDKLVYKVKVFFDRQLVKVYNFLKRNTNISDKTIEKLLRVFFKNK